MNARWMNIFIRDFLLVIVVGLLHYLTHFNSHTVFFITGMLVVYITWQLSDMLNEVKINKAVKEWDGLHLTTS
jgi:hypothetical protein